VDELERGRSGKRALYAPAARVRDGEAEDGAHTLPSGLERVAQRLVEAAEVGRELKRAEVLLDDVAELVSRQHPPGCERV
jgi:hypothetical protein